jgi:hypothetical protein
MCAMSPVEAKHVAGPALDRLVAQARGWTLKDGRWVDDCGARMNSFQPSRCNEDAEKLTRLSCWDEGLKLERQDVFDDGVPETRWFYYCLMVMGGEPTRVIMPWSRTKAEATANAFLFCATAAKSRMNLGRYALIVTQPEELARYMAKARRAETRPLLGIDTLIPQSTAVHVA